MDKQTQNYKDLGANKYQVLATLDVNTCSKCANMDLKIFTMDSYKEGLTAPPFHDGCRCCTIPYFDDEFNDIGERAARSIDGITYYVPRNTSYYDWINKYIFSNPVEHQKFKIFQIKKKNTKDDYFEYSKYQKSDIFKKSNIGRTFEEFQDIKYKNTNEYHNIQMYYQLYNDNKLLNNITYTKWKKNKKSG